MRIVGPLKSIAPLSLSRISPPHTASEADQRIQIEKWSFCYHFSSCPIIWRRQSNFCSQSKAHRPIRRCQFQRWILFNIHQPGVEWFEMVRLQWTFGTILGFETLRTACLDRDAVDRERVNVCQKNDVDVFQLQ